MQRKYTIFQTVILITLYVLSIGSTCAQAVPSSSRSREVINRIQPRLEKQLHKARLKYGSPIYIRIFKKENELEIWMKAEQRFKLFKKYPICTHGWGSLGPKTSQGDGQAPEGFYYVTPARLNPYSRFHLSFNIGYPNTYDRIHGRTGGSIMVHGDCVSIGCFAMTDSNIEEIYALADAALRNGQGFFRVHIFPFRMSKKNMAKYKGSRWYSFWQNLKQGYDLFEEYGNIPPNVEVENGQYVFNLPHNYP